MKIEFRHLKTTVAAFCAISIAGCGVIPGFKSDLRLSDTPKFYAPRIDSPRAPKPDNAPMPVLSFPPKRKFIVLGTFRMRSRYYDTSFMTAAAIYNARQLGADAILVRDRGGRTHTHIYYPEASTSEDCTSDPGQPEIWSTERDDFSADIIIYE
jgi:hypothetical protein